MPCSQSATTVRFFMKIEVEAQPGSVSTLRIELPPEEVSKEWDAITNSFARLAKIPGYRPGKAPRSVIEKRFRKEIHDELTKKLVSKSYSGAIAFDKGRGGGCRSCAGTFARAIGRFCRCSGTRAANGRFCGDRF